MFLVISLSSKRESLIYYWDLRFKISRISFYIFSKKNNLTVSRIFPMMRIILSCGWRAMRVDPGWNITSLITLTCPWTRSQLLIRYSPAPYKWFFQDSGFYILGKFPNKEKTEIHLTAFKVSGFSNLNYFANTQGIFTFEVPKMVTVYTPGGILHTNNYQVWAVQCTLLIMLRWPRAMRALKELYRIRQ